MEYMTEKDYFKVNKWYLLVTILLVITIGYNYINTTSREEDCYIVCKIIQQDKDGYTQAKLLDGETEWILP